ncbi:DUF5986 family protein [Anaeromusa acidaminophila]|uniref:DUF5986 family protein n=1 Tax=Anaeromusa acidaminophila TaxID=81464 RepID=UPI000360611B|nr:DUF5986 family protein [Anaeromusa acidaminophila]
MNPSGYKIKATDKFISVITKCVSDAVGDDIKGDIKSHGLVTQNSTPTRIWDLLNTNICKNFNQIDIIANPTKRGPWEMVPIFERNTGIVYSLMREQRFELLKKEFPKRRNAHYIDAFARSLNADLCAAKNQLLLFPLCEKKFNNEEFIQEIIEKIFRDLGVPNELVRHHALILFSSFNNELASLRCCVVDSNLGIVDEVDWSNYIKASESIIAGKALDRASVYVEPSGGLKYKQKAKDKMGQKRPAERKKLDGEDKIIT